MWQIIGSSWFVFVTLWSVKYTVGTTITCLSNEIRFYKKKFLARRRPQSQLDIIVDWSHFTPSANHWFIKMFHRCVRCCGAGTRRVFVHSWWTWNRSGSCSDGWHLEWRRLETAALFRTPRNCRSSETDLYKANRHLMMCWLSVMCDLLLTYIRHPEWLVFVNN